MGREAEHLMPRLVSGVKPPPVHTPSDMHDDNFTLPFFMFKKKNFYTVLLPLFQYYHFVAGQCSGCTSADSLEAGGTSY